MREWILPFLSFFSLAFCLGLGVLVWWICRTSARRLQQALAQEQLQTEHLLRTAAEEIERLEHAQKRLAQELETVRLASTPHPGMNLTRRAAALRMSRRGEQPEQIAAALKIPRREVELLLKLHRITLGEKAGSHLNAAGLDRTSTPG